ncbi:MAG TPA: TadE family protein [Terracidiphilus sp.]|nr:TadE family protein [Terracidiphilus sp.]
MIKIQFRENRGAALVELALTTPLFILLLMGAVEFGRIAYYSIEVENAARAGASYGAVNKGNAADGASIQIAAQNDAPDLPNLVSTPGHSCVCETLDTSSKPAIPTFNPSITSSPATADCESDAIHACTVVTSTSSQKVVEFVTVSTQADVDPLIHLPGLPNAYRLSGFSALRVLAN